MKAVGKKTKGGLRKCPLHKFGAEYTKYEEPWFRCGKCKGFQEIPGVIIKENPERIMIKKSLIGKHVDYEIL